MLLQLGAAPQSKLFGLPMMLACFTPFHVFETVNSNGGLIIAMSMDQPPYFRARTTCSAHSFMDFPHGFYSVSLF